MVSRLADAFFRVGWSEKVKIRFKNSLFLKFVNAKLTESDRLVANLILILNFKELNAFPLKIISTCLALLPHIKNFDLCGLAFII